MFSLVSSPIFAVDKPTSPLTCKVHAFLVDENYKLPYRYDMPELEMEGVGSKIKPGDYIIYSFEVKNNADKLRHSIKKVTTSQLMGSKEPLEILNTRPQNGSCTVDSNKQIICNLDYSFVEDASYPIEYLVKITDNPNSYPKTSSLFNVETDNAKAECASWLWIKDITKPNKVSWETPYAKITSSDFYIKIGDKKFYGKDPVSIHSDPGTDKTTLEVSWRENGVEMRLYLYFRKIEKNMWEMYEMRTYNGEVKGDWIYYKDSLGNAVSSLVGYHNYQDEVIFIPTNGKDAEVYCKHCDINAFMPRNNPISDEGYSLEALIGLPKGEIITLSTDPMSGYGVNVLLKDKEGNVVTDQKDFGYVWGAKESDIVKIAAGTLDYGKGSCAYGILAPCPPNHIDLTGLAEGETTVTAKVTRNSDQKVIASTSFPVKVISRGVPTPSNNPDQDVEKMKKDIEKLNQEMAKQKSEVGSLGQVVDNIRKFLQSIFGKIFNF
jgi:hypothetical protein